MKRQFVLSAIFAALSAVLCGSFYYGYKMQQELEIITMRFNDVRFNPTGQSFSDKAILPLDTFSLVLLGDSHVGDWPLSASSLLNLGISAQTSSQIRIRSDQYGDKLKGEFLLICTGGVDVLSMKPSSFSTDQLAANFENNLRQMVTNHQSNFKSIILMTIPPRFYTPHKTNNHSENKQIDSIIQRFNTVIKEIASTHNLLILDAYTILSSHSANKPYSDDGIHMNTLGYSLLREALSSIPDLKPVLASN